MRSYAESRYLLFTLVARQREDQRQLALPSSAVAATDLGLRLKLKREHLLISGSAVGKAASISPQFLSNIENGLKTLTEEKLELVADHLEFTGTERAELLRLRDLASMPSPFASFSTVLSPRLARYFALEWGADTVRTFDGGVIQGLLQPEEYAAAVIAAGRTYIPPTQVKRRVAARLQRHTRLWGPSPLQLISVMGEAALRQLPGGPQIQIETLHHLADLISKRPETLEVYIAPYDSAHSAMGASSFELMYFDEGRVPPQLWTEAGVTVGQLTSDEQTVHEFAVTHQDVIDNPKVLDREDSLSLILQVAKELG